MDIIQDNRKITKGKITELYNKVRKIKNIEVAIAIIVLALILIIYAGVTTINKNKDEDVNTDSESDNLEIRLESILKEINGAGEVKVMITYDGSIEYVTANTSNINTNTTTDTTRTNTTTSTTISPIIINKDGSSGPVIIKEIEPGIKGVIIVAEGANDLMVRLELMRAVMVALDIGAQNIEIFAMK